MKGHIMKGPWLCRNSWETFWSEELLALWNKMAFGVVSQCVCSLLPGRQLRSWDCSQGSGQGGSLHFLSVSKSACERDSNSRDNAWREPLSCQLRTTAHLSWQGWFLLKVYIETGGLSARWEVLGRDWQYLLKSIFTVPGALLWLPKEVCFPFIVEESVDPSPASHKCLHLYSDSEKCLIFQDESNRCFSQEMN